MMDATNALRTNDQAFLDAGSIDHTEAGTVANGVRAPKQEDASFKVWSALNTLNSWGATPSGLTASRLASKLGLDLNSTVVTYLQWKKFHGEGA